MKYCIKMTTGTLPILEDEVPKVLQAMDKKGIVVLKAGIVSGAYIISIERDFHGERDLNYGYDVSKELKRGDYGGSNFSDEIRKLSNNHKLLQ